MFRERKAEYSQLLETLLAASTFCSSVYEMANVFEMKSKNSY